MKKPYTEGSATHGDPESCAGKEQGAGEALTGADTGREIEPRNTLQSGAPTPSLKAEGNTMTRESVSSSSAPRGLRPRACVESLCARTGRPTDRPSEDGSSGRDGKGERPTPPMN